MKNEELTLNTIRLLGVDAIQKAKSGHPGIVLGAAPMMYELWANGMKHNPKNPDWQNRDRFILSAGHGSALLYSMLHVFGYSKEGEAAVSLDDLKNFRQWDSKTPGHPEYGHTTGVEVTTGPLGQGIANAVGMAMAESHLAAKFNRPGFDVVDHNTFVVCGEGCLEEGISAEASSLAGTLGLGKLILLYDKNDITIEGDISTSFTEDVGKRYEAYNWHVQYVADGNDLNEINKAIEKAKKESSRPSIIIVRTQIGYGAPNKQGKASAHGEPLGEAELALTKAHFGFDPDKRFYVPNEVESFIIDKVNHLATEEATWKDLMARYREAYPELYAEFMACQNNELPMDLLNSDTFWDYSGTGDIATRSSSELVLNRLAELGINLFGGSADLAPSNKSIMKGKDYFSPTTPEGANIHYGIREHAMTAIANGMAVHGGVRPYIAGFFVFSDYMKPAMRLSAQMKLPVISIMTHDSIGVGEDGPTHQPVEQLAALRSIPNYTVIRPCDTNETAAAWYLALTRVSSPTSIVLSRQNLAQFKETGKDALRGGYILRDSEGTPDIILIASGSEVKLIYDAYEVLKQQGINARVVSMPSIEIFEEQRPEYKESILPEAIRARLVVEAGSSLGWAKYIGLDGEIISIDTFGASAPADRLFEEYGFTVENVVAKAERVVKKMPIIINLKELINQKIADPVEQLTVLLNLGYNWSSTRISEITGISEEKVNESLVSGLSKIDSKAKPGLVAADLYLK